MDDRDYFAAQTHVEWQRAVDALRDAGNRRPSIDDVLIARARMRYAEADAMLQVRAETASSSGTGNAKE